MQRRRPCRRTPASGSTSARAARQCCAQRPATAACSALTARTSARRSRLARRRAARIPFSTHGSRLTIGRAGGGRPELVPAGVSWSRASLLREVGLSCCASSRSASVPVSTLTGVYPSRNAAKPAAPVDDVADAGESCWRGRQARQDRPGEPRALATGARASPGRGASPSRRGTPRPRARCRRNSLGAGKPRPLALRSPRRFRSCCDA